MYGVTKYGTGQFSNTVIDENELAVYTPDLLKYLPPVYQIILEIRAIQDAIAPELGLIKFGVDNVIDQVFVDSSTRGLERWEQELALQTDISKPAYFRRERIKAKLKGTATTTKLMIKNIAETFSGAEVEVVEHNELHAFTVKFIGMKGIPPNMAGLIEAIEEIKPAHLVYDFAYTYTWWDTLKDAELIWNQAGLKTWNELKVY